MENRIYLDDIIAILTNKGYVWEPEKSVYDIDLIDEGYKTLPISDFLIDEVYCCNDKESGEISYILAISSLKEKLKFIVINVITKETSITIRDVLSKIQSGIMRLLKWE